MSLPTVTPVIPVTTVQLSNTPITVTSASSSSSSQIPSPTLSARPAGWHAKSFGFDWNKRANQHKYLVKTGLPKVHAAIMNDDWDLALELICPEDFGLNWLPSTSKSPQKNSRMDLEASRWPVTLLSQNQDARKHAIMNMAIQTCNATSIGNKSLYGTNLLTLCLLKPALDKLIAAGLQLLDVILTDPNYISQLADLDPQGFAEKTKGLENKIHSLVNSTKTAAGNQAVNVLFAKFGDKS